MLARAAVFVLLLVSPALAGEPRAHPRETFDVEAARAALTPEQLANKREFVDAFAQSVRRWGAQSCPDAIATLQLQEQPWPEDLDIANRGMIGGWLIGYLPAIRCYLRIEALRDELDVRGGIGEALSDKGTSFDIPGEPTPHLANQYIDLYYAWLWQADVGSQLDMVEARVFAELGAEEADIAAGVAAHMWEHAVLGGAYEAHQRLDEILRNKGQGP